MRAGGPAPERTGITGFITMEILYTPWRLSYIQGLTTKAPGCIFCDAISGGPAKASLVLFSDNDAAVMLNRYPYNNGHLMVIPALHADSLTALDPACRARCSELLAHCEVVLRETYKCEGLNMGMNLGESAGAGIADHIHWHILPRWKGDTNFLSVVGGTRIIPEKLDDTYDRLKPRFDKI